MSGNVARGGCKKDRQRVRERERERERETERLEAVVKERGARIQSRNRVKRLLSSSPVPPCSLTASNTEEDNGQRKETNSD